MMFGMRKRKARPTIYCLPCETTMLWYSTGPYPHDYYAQCPDCGHKATLFSTWSL